MYRFIALFVALLLLAACAHGTGARDSHRLVVGVLEEPDRLDPLLGNLVADNDAFALAFDGLVRFGPGGTIVPDLATEVPSRANGGISADGKTITYRLRHGVRWQDGAPFTSRDVVFTWRALVDPHNLVPAHGEYDRIATMTAPDAYTVAMHLRAPYAPAPALFALAKQGAIVPAHLLEGRELSRADFESHPVGTGPYRVVAWRRGDSIDFTRSPFARERPYFDRVQLRFYPNEQALAIAAQTHEVDVALGLSPQTVRRLRNAGGLTIASAPTYEFEQLTFNLRKDSGPQTDPVVRRAFARAIDVRRYAQTVFSGRAGLAPLDQAPWSWALASGVRFYPYDPQRARRELLAAGYKLPVALTIVSTAGNDNRSRLEIAMQSDLARAGIALTIKNVPANLMLARQADGGILTGGRFQVALFTFAATSPDPNDERYITTAAIPPNGVNMAAYSNPLIDRMAAAGVATYDRRTRAGLYSRIQQTLIADLPFYTLAWMPQIIVSGRDLRGITPLPIGSALATASAWQRDIARP
jgi:peptide/nickel transport system substrate-binding protein